MIFQICAIGTTKESGLLTYCSPSWADDNIVWLMNVSLPQIRIVGAIGKGEW